MSMRNYKWLLLAIIVGFLLRVIDLDNTPRALYGDELTMVYDSYSLLHTGTDQLGNPWPVTFQMGAGRPGGYVYASIPFVSIFGPGAYGVRALSILSGVGLILAVYFMCRKLFSTSLAVIAAWLVALSPWAISLSRGGFEANFALFLATLGICFALYSQSKKWLILCWVICWGLVVNTYPTYKLILPFFGLVLLNYLGFKRVFTSENKKVIWVSVMFIVFFVSIITQQFFWGNSESRFLSINIFSDNDISRQITEKVNFDRERSDLPEIIQPIFTNKYWEYSKILFSSYLENFSPSFLFVSGDGNPRHNPGESGGFYWLEVLTMFLGFGALWSKYKRIMWLFLPWIIVAPIGSALLGVPHFLRASFLMIPLICISALGWEEIWKYRGRFSLIYRNVFMAIYILSICIYLIYLFSISGSKTEEFWSYAARLASNEIMLNQSKFDYIIVSDRVDDVEFAYPVYAKIDPRLIISQNKDRTVLNGMAFKQIDNVYIGKIPDGWHEGLFKNLKGTVLFIGSMYDDRFVFQAEHLVDRKGRELVVIKRIK